MKVLIQCAGSKDPRAQTLTLNAKGQEFVANPALRPGAVSPWEEVPRLDGMDWIDALRALNQIEGAESWAIFERRPGSGRRVQR